MDEAYNFLAYAARLDLDNYNRNTEQGIHSSSAAGVWASMVSGFGGLRTDGDLLIFNPTIPAKWNSYSFKLSYGGALIKVEVNKEYATFTIESGPEIKVKIYGQERLINQNGVKVKLCE